MLNPYIILYKLQSRKCIRDGNYVYYVMVMVPMYVQVHVIGDNYILNTRITVIYVKNKIIGYTK